MRPPLFSRRTAQCKGPDAARARKLGQRSQMKSDKPTEHDA
jgi:hypothetical protein